MALQGDMSDSLEKLGLSLYFRKPYLNWCLRHFLISHLPFLEKQHVLIVLKSFRCLSHFPPFAFAAWQDIERTGSRRPAGRLRP